MLFNSLEFAVFFPLVVGAFFWLPHRWRWLLLLLASAGFYMAFVPVYILILGATIFVDYFVGLGLENPGWVRHRRKLLVASIVANMGVLAVFKYYNWFALSANEMSKWLGMGDPLPRLGILLPIGLSFHTFQALSYIIEVYRGRQSAERHFGLYALYVMFFPQLVAGPIERPQNVLHQFHEKKEFSYDAAMSGLKQMAWGFFKKLVVADRLSEIVDPAFAAPAGASGITLLVGTVFFAFQIYCDFSGYSDIALGAARVMGFNLMRNFNLPYFSSSISDFWSRWHISLSTWFRDYLYVPMGGNRAGFGRWQFNLLVVFLVSGIWHGANWTYVFWGGLHALFAMIQNLFRRWSTMSGGVVRCPNWAGWLITFTAVCLAWVLFRSQSIGDAWIIYRKILDIPGMFRELAGPGSVIRSFGASAEDFLLACVSIGLLLAGEVGLDSVSVRNRFAALPRWLRWWGYASFVTLILVLGKIYSSSREFIYFQF